MAEERWVVVDKRWCEYRQEEANLRERRAFPGGVQAHFQAPRTLERMCDYAIACNMEGVPCKWSFLNPDNDPFERE